MILLEGAEGADILTQIMDRFLIARDAAWWWEVLKVPCRTLPGKSLEDVPGICPDPGAEVYLVPCDSWPLEVYRTTPHSAARVLGECPCMEYAVVAADLSWMIIENHHGAFFVAGDFAQLHLAGSKPGDLNAHVELPSSLKRLAEDLRVTLHIIAWSSPLELSAFLGILGFAKPWETLYPISREEAQRRLANLAAYDQAYDWPADSIEIAAECAREFVESFAEDCRFFTNSTHRIDASSRAWRPLTNSTFDSGVIAISAERGGVLWFEDDD